MGGPQKERKKKGSRGPSGGNGIKKLEGATKRQKVPSGEVKQREPQEPKRVTKKNDFDRPRNKPGVLRKEKSVSEKEASCCPALGGGPWSNGQGNNAPGGVVGKGRTVGGPTRKDRPVGLGGKKPGRRGG